MCFFSARKEELLISLPIVCHMTTIQVPNSRLKITIILTKKPNHPNFALLPSIVLLRSQGVLFPFRVNIKASKVDSDSQCALELTLRCSPNDLQIIGIHPGGLLSSILNVSLNILGLCVVVAHYQLIMTMKRGKK